MATLPLKQLNTISTANLPINNFLLFDNNNNGTKINYNTLAQAILDKWADTKYTIASTSKTIPNFISPIISTNRISLLNKLVYIPFGTRTASSTMNKRTSNYVQNGTDYPFAYFTNVGGNLYNSDGTPNNAVSGNDIAIVGRLNSNSSKYFTIFDSDGDMPIYTSISNLNTFKTNATSSFSTLDSSITTLNTFKTNATSSFTTLNTFKTNATSSFSTLNNKFGNREILSVTHIGLKNPSSIGSGSSSARFFNVQATVAKTQQATGAWFFPTGTNHYWITFYNTQPTASLSGSTFTVKSTLQDTRATTSSAAANYYIGAGWLVQYKTV